MKLVFFILFIMIVSMYAIPKPRAVGQNIMKRQVHIPSHVSSFLGTHKHIHSIPNPLNHYQNTIVSHGVHSHLADNQIRFSKHHISALNYINIARLSYCPKKLILAKRCEVCPFILNQYKTFFIHSVNQNKKRLFQFLIIYSDKKKEILITFSGPKTTETKFFNKIYKSGFITVKDLGENIRIENYYWEIYSKYIRSVLIIKVKKVLDSKRSDYKVVFTGHSFGGAMASLAAFDLIKKGIIKKNKINESPIIYTYGQMRLGDNSFVLAANNLIKLIRIVRTDDFVTRVPSCVFDSDTKLFNCYRRVASVVKHYPILKRYFVDYRRGVKLYRKSILKRFYKTAGVHYHTYFSQPLGAILSYNGNDFSTYQVCPFNNGIPSCEENLALPRSFSPTAHEHYFGIAIESC